MTLPIYPDTSPFAAAFVVFTLPLALIAGLFTGYTARPRLLLYAGVVLVLLFAGAMGHAWITIDGIPPQNRKFEDLVFAIYPALFGASVVLGGLAWGAGRWAGRR